MRSAHGSSESSRRRRWARSGTKRRAARPRRRVSRPKRRRRKRMRSPTATAASCLFCRRGLCRAASRPCAASSPPSCAAHERTPRLHRLRRGGEPARRRHVRDAPVCAPSCPFCHPSLCASCRPQPRPAALHLRPHPPPHAAPARHQRRCQSAAVAVASAAGARAARAAPHNSATHRTSVAAPAVSHGFAAALAPPPALRARHTARLSGCVG